MPYEEKQQRFPAHGVCPAPSPRKATSPKLYRLLFIATVTATLTGCVKQTATNILADQLSSSTSSSFGSDEDLQLIGEAVPFALKLMESIASATPEHVEIHQALASGFTQYSMVYVLHPAETSKDQDLEAFRAAQARAARLFIRARDYGLRTLEIRHPGFSSHLMDAPAAALEKLTVEDAPLLYWTATPWLGAISVSKEDMARIGEVPFAVGMLDRALELDPRWNQGAIHDMLIAIEPLRPEPGWQERSRQHFKQAVELSNGQRLSPYVSLATTVSVANQNRAEFEALLQEALSIPLENSPEELTANTFYRERAVWLLSQIDDLFI